MQKQEHVSGNDSRNVAPLTDPWSALRAALAAIGFREEALPHHRRRLEAALDAVIRAAHAENQRVEVLIIRLKQLCAEPRLADVDRLERGWLVSQLVQRCIERFYGDQA